MAVYESDTWEILFDENGVTRRLASPENTNVSTDFSADYAGVFVIKVTRKNIRNMYLHPQPGGQVFLSAPLRLSDDRILAFINEKKDWLIRQKRRLKNVTPMKMLSFETGELVYYKGRPLTLQVLPDRRSSLSIGESSVLMYVPPRWSTPERERFYKAQMKLRLSRLLAEKIAYWEKTMSLRSSGFCIRDMKSRWGSCHCQTRKLTFNLHLIEEKPLCTDYVVVHELAHLRYPSHDKDFWGLVASYLPDYKQIRHDLNEPDRTRAGDDT